MTFSFEPFLAISAGHIMAVSAVPEHVHHGMDAFLIYSVAQHLHLSYPPDTRYTPRPL